MNSSIPAIAAAAPTDILNSGATDGANSIISSKAKAALWLAPTIEGSTKRFFIRICIIMPATASEAPLNTTANVRGRRLISINCILSAEEKIRDQWNSATPTDKLNANSGSNINRLARLNTNACRFMIISLNG